MDKLFKKLYKAQLEWELQTWSQKGIVGTSKKEREKILKDIKLDLKNLEKNRLTKRD